MTRALWMSWCPSRRLWRGADGTPRLPVVVNQIRADYILRTDGARWPWQRRRTRQRLADVAIAATGGRCFAGSASDQSLSALGLYVCAESETARCAIRDEHLARPLDRAAIVADLEAALVWDPFCWIVAEPAWEALTHGVSAADTADRIATIVGAMREIVPEIPILWTEATAAWREIGWTRRNFLSIVERIRPLVEIVGANWYPAPSKPIEPTTRPRWWADVPGPKALSECSWHPYEWVRAHADPKRLERAGWQLPTPEEERAWPSCASPDDRLRRWEGLLQCIAADPDLVMIGYCGGVGHADADAGTGKAYRPWGLLQDPATGRWFSGADADAAREIVERVERTWLAARRPIGAIGEAEAGDAAR